MIAVTVVSFLVTVTAFEFVDVQYFHHHHKILTVLQ
jgi:hypothetical protein